MPWIAWVLSGFSVLLAMVGLLRTFIVAGRDRSEHLIEDLTHLQERTGLLEMKMGMFWRLVEEHLSTMLKRPTHLEMDALLDKLKSHTLILDECRILRRWLHHVYLDHKDTLAQERIIAILVIAAVESLIHEYERSS